jgi:hypothetical protein
MAQRKENLEAAAGFEGGGVVDHLENEGAAAAHLDLADVEAGPQGGLRGENSCRRIGHPGPRSPGSSASPRTPRRHLETVVGLDPRGASRGVG